jgi:polyisoprenoid-binding protein YceI
MHRPLAVLLLAAGLALPAAADSYSLDARHTFPIFEVSHLGFSLQRGRFNKTSGKVVLDLAARQGRIEVSIDTASIDMGLDDWDKHMRDADFFDVQRHPTMTYVADRLLFDGNTPVAAEGHLTLLGVTRPVRLEIANFRCGIHPLNRRLACGAEVATRIRRSEFGMTKYLPAVGDEIRIVIPVEAYRD